MSFKEKLIEDLKNPDLRSGVEDVLVEFSYDLLDYIKEKIPGKADNMVIDNYAKPAVKPGVDKFLDKYYVKDKD